MKQKVTFFRDLVIPPGFLPTATISKYDTEYFWSFHRSEYFDAMINEKLLRASEGQGIHGIPNPDDTFPPVFDAIDCIRAYAIYHRGMVQRDSMKSIVTKIQHPENDSYAFTQVIGDFILRHLSSTRNWPCTVRSYPKYERPTKLGTIGAVNKAYHNLSLDFPAT